MHHLPLAFGLLALALSGCGQGVSRAQADRAVAEAQAVDQANLSEIMLTVGDPQEAVTYFRNALASNPDKIALKRGLARSQLRAGLLAEANVTVTDLLATPGATDDDRLLLADVQIRQGDWDGAAKTLNAIPPTVESYERYRLEAMVADSQENWKKADSFYSVAVGLTSKPQSILNNWGCSKLTRGDGPGAEKLFLQALTYDPSMFTDKNNLVMARAMQRKYDMPVITMTQEERARLLYTAGLAAVKQGDPVTGKRLLREAVDTSPTYFEEAARSLDALEGK